MHEQQEKEWLAELEGRTLKGVRPNHNHGPVPQVTLMFTDGTTFTIDVLDGVFFEGCLVNTLRRAQPVVGVMIARKDKDSMLEIRAKTFPLLQLQARNKGIGEAEFPFVLTKADG